MKLIKSLIKLCEAFYCIGMPIHLYGWQRGILIASALTSLLYIVLLLEINNE